MILLYKIFNGLTSKYLFDIIPVLNDSCYDSRAQSNSELTKFYSRTKSFSTTFFSFCIKEWNKLDAKIRNLSSVSRFRLIYFKTDENSVFGVHNPIAMKLLNRLRPHFRHLNEHNILHNFQDTVNPLCLCNTETETASHYLLRCPLFSEKRTKLRNLDNTLFNHCDDDLVKISLYGPSNYSFSTNNKILLH